MTEPTGDLNRPRDAERRSAGSERLRRTSGLRRAVRASLGRRPKVAPRPRHSRFRRTQCKPGLGTRAGRCRHRRARRRPRPSWIATRKSADDHARDAVSPPVSTRPTEARMTSRSQAELGSCAELTDAGDLPAIGGGRRGKYRGWTGLTRPTGLFHPLYRGYGGLPDQRPAISPAGTRPAVGGRGYGLGCHRAGSACTTARFRRLRARPVGIEGHGTNAGRGRGGPYTSFRPRGAPALRRSLSGACAG
jgi:hypothetical protein